MVNKKNQKIAFCINIMQILYVIGEQDDQMHICMSFVFSSISSVVICIKFMVVYRVPSEIMKRYHVRNLFEFREHAQGKYNFD